MNNLNKDKQVLLAILNVKKYAKKLKKNASHLQEVNDDRQFNQAVSSSSYFQTQQNMDFLEPNSPMLVTKSSYNQTFIPSNRQKKQHSMTLIPGGRKIQREARKNSEVILYQPSSPSKTYTSTRQQLTKSYKKQAIGSNTGNQGVWKKQQKNTFILFQRKNSKNDKDAQNQVDLQQLGRTLTVPLNKNKQTPSRENSSIIGNRTQNPKLTLQLLQQINTLKTKISMYKNALMTIRTKYLQMQQKIKMKAQCDHQLDMYLQKICTLQSQKQQLMQTITKQNTKIIQFQSLIIQISYKFQQFYKDKLDALKKLQVQNKVYIQLLKIYSPTMQPSLSKNNPHSIIQKNKQKQQVDLLKIQKNKYEDIQVNNYSQSSQSQNQCYEKQLRISVNKLCKNQKDISDKYPTKFINQYENNFR